ncbi:MAG: hypothetical protein JWQ96_1440 [Segetibacter sp.]|nr:hypothetical protein [Segetibacter sp.]
MVMGLRDASCRFYSWAIFFAKKGQSQDPASQKEHDTLRALRLVQLSATYSQLAPDTGLVIATKALNLSRKNKFKSGEALSLLQQGWTFSFLGNQAMALEKVLEAFRLGEKINDNEIIRDCLNGLGVIYKREGD